MLRLLLRMVSRLRTRRQQGAVAAASAWLKKSQDLLEEMKEQETWMNKIQADLESAISDNQALLSEAKLLIGRYEPAMEAVRNELQIATDHVIPSLVAQHRLILERAMADLDYQVRRRVSYNVKDE